MDTNWAGLQHDPVADFEKRADNHGMDRTTDVIQRAFELAQESRSLDEIRSKLKHEGFSNVDAHLAGGQIRADLTKIFKRNA